MSNTDVSMVLVEGLDQPLAVDMDNFFVGIDSILDAAIEEQNVDKALDAVLSLRKAAQMSGMGLARMLFKIKQNWNRFEIDGTFEDVAYERCGLHKQTVARYIEVWDMYNAGYVPETVAPKLQARNIKDQIPVAKAISQGYEISDEQWDELANAPDSATVGKILRDVKGKEPRKSGLSMTIGGNGSIYVMQGDKRVYVGNLQVTSENETVQKAIERIIKNSGIMRV